MWSLFLSIVVPSFGLPFPLGCSARLSSLFIFSQARKNDGPLFIVGLYSPCGNLGPNTILDCSNVLVFVVPRQFWLSCISWSLPGGSFRRSPFWFLAVTAHTSNNFWVRTNDYHISIFSTHFTFFCAVSPFYPRRERRKRMDPVCICMESNR